MTRASKQGAVPHLDLAEDQVLGYLRRNPDFLARHPDLFTKLVPPARKFGNGRDATVMDLQQFMLGRLREDVGRLEKRHDALVDTSRSNLRTQSRVHAAALALLSARSFESFIEIVTTDLAMLLEIDVVAMCIECSEVTRVRPDGIRLLPSGSIDELLGRRADVVLRENTVGERWLYGSGAGLVRSDALLRLRVRRQPPDALLALGARTPGHFHAGQATELLSFLARVLEHGIRNWLDVPA
ncbi:MAG: DUF484 family protein [Alphaproteobacteria bacterium]